MRNAILTLLLLLTLSQAFAQFDERAILTQNAQQLTFQRQFTEAEQAWLKLLQSYPNDLNAVIQLFQLYLQINKTDKAEKVLTDYRSVIPNNTWLENDIQLDIHMAKLTDAWDKTQSYIQLSPNEEYRYRLMAGYFERKGFYDQAIRLFEQGRTTLKRPELFCMEIGNNAFNVQNYAKALTEYVKFLEVQPGNLYFVGNQLKTILAENPDLITRLKSLANVSSSMEVKEVYAISLSRLKRFKEALKEYEQLPTEKLMSFANEQYSAGNDTLAILAYNALRNRQLDVMAQGEVLLKTAESYIRLRQFTQADSVLTAIVNPITKKVSPQFERKRFPYQAFLIFSDLAQWLHKDVETVTGLLAEAKKLATNADDRQEADFRLVGILFVNEQYEQAEKILTLQSSSKQIDRTFYYKCLIAFAKQELVIADSLLNQLVITAPSSKYVNDLMILNILLMNLPENTQSTLLTAFRYRLGHKDSLAVKTLYDLSVRAKDEELRILAADWAVASGFYQWADNIFTHEWQDELLKQYAALQRSKLQSTTISAESMAQDFLKSNPNSVFSPSFRQILQKAPTGRPNL
jgi:hypothetical protein